jgi:Leucine-rich repeat (LRR) protein
LSTESDLESNHNDGTTSEAPHLEELTLSHNGISTIPTCASPSKSPRVLRIGFNPILERKEFIKS